MISIVVPIYNTESYLRECLDSLLEQKCSDYEIICIDDGSTDGSRHILLEYESKNDNIRVIKKKNGGVSSARNLGIEEAKGEWIWFVDSDDYIAENAITELSRIVQQGDCDMVMFGVKRVKNYNHIIANFKDIKIIRGKHEAYNAIPSIGGGNGPCYYLFKKRIIERNSLRFDERMKYAEDTKFIFEYRLNINSVIEICSEFYFYRQRPGSAMTLINKEAHLYCMKRLVQTYLKYSEKDIDELINLSIKQKTRQAIRAVLFDIMFYFRDITLAKETLIEFTAKGIYPNITEKDCFRKLPKIYKRYGIKILLVDFIHCFLGCKWLYLSLVKRMQVIKGKPLQ